MKIWHFSELAYYPAWKELGSQLRNVVPSRLCDPKVAADLYHRGLDEWALCDELGLNIMPALPKDAPPGGGSGSITTTSRPERRR